MSINRFGLVKTTLIDYPAKVACSIFTIGCNLRCPYCHNPELVLNKDIPHITTLNEFENFLKKRSKLIQGVCITGGEPLMHDDLPDLIDIIHSYNLSIKLDTNGTFPEKLKELKPDYIAMDIKTSLDRYGELSNGSKVKIEKKFSESIEYIKSSGIDHGSRTTVVPGLVGIEEIEKIIPLIRNTQKYMIAQFMPGKTLNPEYSNITPYPMQELEKMKELLLKSGIKCIIRGSL